MKNEKGFGTALLIEGFAAVIFAGTMAAHMVAGHGELGKIYDAARFSRGNLVMMMDSKPKLFNAYRAECNDGQTLPDNACQRIKTAYEVNGPAY